jgi:hypothetical protein
VRHPAFRDGSNPFADSFQRLTYGGFLLRQGLSQSVPTRILANRTMERQLLWDLGHPDAFKNNSKFHTALLDEDDFALNRASFKEVGFSAGNFYNTYCNARVTLADGRIYVFGGHDMQSQNGLYKVNIFDPETETWVPRARPCTIDNWRKDPFGMNLFAADPEARHYPGCNQLDIRNTQPPEPSDGRYARWYPTAVPLPNNTVLIIGGTDQDASVGPDPLAADKGRNDQSQSDTAFSATRVTQAVPEIYDPKTDRHIALENARMTFPLYPQGEVVQTGPGENDWVVCTQGGVRVQNPVGPGGDRFFGPFDKKTWCLDVIGALKDPKREVPAENHWTLLSEAARDRHYCCPTASLIETDKNGRTVTHKWYMFSGRDRATGGLTATIEEIDFTAPSPQWRQVGNLVHPSTTSKVVVLPDGKVLIGNGLFPQGATFEERAGLRYQLFNPADGTTRPLAKTTVPRGLHGTVTLLPDATALFAGENREALVRPDDPSFPMAGFPVGDPDLGVPNGQIVKPPYLFNRDGSPAARPAIVKAPLKLSYKSHFDIQVGNPIDIASVVLIRSDHNTHSLTAGDRYVKLAFDRSGDPRKRELKVYTPRFPAQAIPGIYMLFVVNRAGVPSTAKRVDLMEN